MSVGVRDFIASTVILDGHTATGTSADAVQFSADNAELVDYLRCIGTDAHSTFVKLVEELLQVNRISPALLAQFRIYFCRSAFVSGMWTPDIRDMDEGKCVCVKEDGRRRLQRVFAAHKFYGICRSRFDSVMVHVRVIQHDGSPRYQVWFAKVLGIVQIKSNLGMRHASGHCLAHMRMPCDICDRKVDGEYVFLQYYDIVSDEELPIDAVDKKLGCIRLIWDRHGGATDTMGPGKLYALSPLDSIRGRVSVVRATELVAPLHSEVAYKKKLVELVGDSGTWEKELFYVNRFHCDDDATFDRMAESTAGSASGIRESEANASSA